MKIIDIVSKMPPGIQKVFTELYIDFNFFFKNVKVKVKGSENLEKAERPCIFISNHLSNLDGVILSRLLKKEFDPYFVAGIKLNHEKLTNLFKNFFKTIDIRPNTADLDSMRSIINAVKEGHNIVIFPEGTRSRTGEMAEAKKGILFIAKMTKAEIVPISLSGTEKVLPVDRAENMGNERIKKGTIDVVIGEPFKIPARKKDEDKTEYDDRTLAMIMGSVAKGLPEEYRGYYRDKV